MNDQDLRDCFAMFAMMGKLINGTPWKPEECFYLADCMIEQRNKRETNEESNNGIAAVVIKRNRKR